MCAPTGRLTFCSPFQKPKTRMPYYSDKPTDEDEVPHWPRPELHGKASRPGNTPFVPTDESSDEEQLPRIGTLARTRRLLLAALRVWELKHGIRD